MDPQEQYELYVLPITWTNGLIAGDWSELDDDEIEDAFRWLKKYKPGKCLEVTYVGKRIDDALEEEVICGEYLFATRIRDMYPDELHDEHGVKMKDFH